MLVRILILAKVVILLLVLVFVDLAKGLEIREFRIPPGISGYYLTTAPPLTATLRVSSAHALGVFFEKSALSTIEEVVYFDLDKSDLKGGEKGKLEELLPALKRAESINLTGFTCDLGTKEHNETLALRRAEAVKEYLVSRGVPAEIIAVRGKGKCCYVSSDRRLNRRVEVEALLKRSSTAHVNSLKEVAR